MTNFNPGDKIYCADGRRGEFVTHVAGEGFVIRFGFYQPGGGDESGEYFDGVDIVQKIFDKPPIEALSKTVKDLEDRAKNLRTEIRESENVLRDRKRYALETLEKCKKYQGLADIEAWIDGKITHLVVSDYSAVKVQPIEVALKEEDDRYNKHRKLMTLFGGSNGNLQWRLNSYRDGSGSGWIDVYPFLNEQDARAKAIEILTFRFAEALEKKHHSSYEIASAKALGMEIPADFKAFSDGRLHAAAQKEVAEAEAKLAAAKARIGIPT